MGLMSFTNGALMKIFLKASGFITYVSHEEWLYELDRYFNAKIQRKKSFINQIGVVTYSSNEKIALLTRSTL